MKREYKFSDWIVRKKSDNHYENTETIERTPTRTSKIGGSKYKFIPLIIYCIGIIVTISIISCFL